MTDEPSEMLVFGGRRGDPSLTLTHVDDDEWIPAFAATIEGESISARLTVTTFTGPELAGFFSQLAAEFRGWPGARAWESEYRSLKVSAVHRPMGHVALTWTLNGRDDSGEPWSATITTVVEAGAEMQRLAEDAAVFFMHGMGAV